VGTGVQVRLLRDFLGVASPYFPELLAIRPALTNKWARGLLVMGDAGCAQGVTAPNIVHDAFPSIARVGKGERIS
jgi:hypothetical protein